MENEQKSSPTIDAPNPSRYDPVILWNHSIKTLQTGSLSKRRLLALYGLPMAWFFTNHYLAAPRGFYQGIFWPLFLLITLWFFKDELRFKDPIVVLSGLGVLAGSIHSIRYAQMDMSALNFMALPLLSVFCLIVATRSHREITLRPFLSTLDSLLIKPLLSIFRIIPFLTNPKDQARPLSTFKQQLREILIGLMIAIPIVLYLLSLLVKADLDFAQSVNAFLNGFLQFNLGDLSSRILISFIALVYFLGVVMGIRLNQQQAAIRMNFKGNQSAITSVIILWSVNLLYLLFTLTQLKTLYFPKEALTAMNLGIAQYARSGFFSLLLVILINLVLLWYLNSSTKSSIRLNQAMKIGYFMMTFFTINLIGSSFYKMSLYEATYGFTFLRLIVKFALIFFSLGLVLMVLFLLNKIKELINPLTLLAITMFIVLSLLNIDGIIVHKAADIYNTTGKLDLVYLSELSTDAYPALADAFHLGDTQDPNLLDLKKKYLANKLETLTSDLYKDHPWAVSITELQFKPY